MELGHENIELELNSSCVITENDVVIIGLIQLSNELRKIEEKFYKIFDLNPCLMAISKLDTCELVDVNDAFVEIVGLESKYDIIGKKTIEDGVDLLKKRDRDKIIELIKSGGNAKNILVKFKNYNGKKLKGLFSASIIKLDGIEYLLTICQIVNKRCILNFCF